jgi:hypothetical protein
VFDDSLNQPALSARKCHIEFSSKGKLLGKTNPILAKTKGTSGSFDEILELDGVDENTPITICVYAEVLY